MQYTFTAGTPHHSGAEVDDYFSAQKQPSPPPSEELAPLVMPPTIKSPSSEMSSLTSPQPAFSTAPPQDLSPTLTRAHTRRPSGSHRPEPMKTRLAMSSMLSYFSDRILTPEMMRAMIILYIGPHNRPDFSQDYLLCPILAPDSLLVQFPKTYFLTGERDPLVDDTVIFAGRLRRAKEAKHHAEQSHNVHLQKEFDDREVVEVVLIPGISHGFLQFVGVFPEGWKHIFRCGRWIEEIFVEAEQRELQTPLGHYGKRAMHHRRRPTESSGDEDFGLEMSISKNSKAKLDAENNLRKQKVSLLKEEMGRRKSQSEKPKFSRQKSMVSLASTDDLLGRRMKGLAGPLTGSGDLDDE